MSDVMNFIRPLHVWSNPLKVFSGMLGDVGFQVLHIQIKDQVSSSITLKHWKVNFSAIFGCRWKLIFFISILGSIKAINPFTNRMPDILKDDFYDEYIAIVDKLGFIRDCEDSIDKYVHAPNKLMVAMVKKI